MHAMPHPSPISLPRLGLLRLPPLHDLVDDTKPHRLLGSHIIIPLQRSAEPAPGAVELFVRSYTVRRVDVRQGGADPEDLFGVEGDIGRLARRAARRFCALSVCRPPFPGYAARDSGLATRDPNSRWIITLLFLRAYRCPFSPPANNKLPILAA